MKVSLGTVKNWESGASSPTADDLAKFHEIGGDVMYILTGGQIAANALQEVRAVYALSPARQFAAKVATMNLTDADVDLLLAVARRICPPE